MKKIFTLLSLLLVSFSTYGNNLQFCEQIWNPSQFSGFSNVPIILPPNKFLGNVNGNSNFTVGGGEFRLTGSSRLNSINVQPNTQNLIYRNSGTTIQNGAKINLNGDPNNLILVVLGDLYIEPNVEIYGYIYVQGDIYFTPRTDSSEGNNCADENNSYFIGGMIATGNIFLEAGQRRCEVSQEFQGNYQPINSTIFNGYSFCINKNNPNFISCNNTNSFNSNLSLNQNWQTGSRNGQIVNTTNNRLRITENNFNETKFSTLRKAFPTTDNIVLIEFDHYSYGTSGGLANGITTTFSDGTIPQNTIINGSSGAGLGYASSDGGFTGGLFTYGIDFSGDFALNNPSFGLTGGSFSTFNNITLRGDTPNATFISSVSNNPINFSSTTPITYRVAFDTRYKNAIHAIWRKINNRYERIILSDQLPKKIPNEVFFSFTGSTSNTEAMINEIGGFEYCAIIEQDPPPNIGNIDHYRLIIPNSNISCLGSNIQVIACTDLNCTTPYNGNTAVTLITDNGNWQGANLISSNAGAGSFTVSAGTTNAFLSNTDTINNVSSLSIDPNSPLLNSSTPNLYCFDTIGNSVPCQVTFNPSGIAFYGDTSNSVINSQISGSDFPIYLRAVDTNTDTGACESRLAGTTQTVNLGLNCTNPTTCSNDVNYNFNANTISLPKNNNSTINTTPVNVTFDAQGYGLINSNYNDSGQIQLFGNLSLTENTNNPSITLNGSSNNFTIKPASLQISNIFKNTTNNPSTTSSGAGFIPAGESFSVIVDGINQQGNITPNFGKEITPIAPTLSISNWVYPSTDLTLLELNNKLINANLFSPNTTGFINNDIYFSDVGSFDLTANFNNDYLGAGSINSSTSVLTGRFYPHHFSIDETSFILNNCNTFSYQGKNLDHYIAINAKGLNNEDLYNYNNNYMGSAVFDLKDDNDAQGSIIFNDTTSWNNGEKIINGLDLSILRDNTNFEPINNLNIGIIIDSSIDNIPFENNNFSSEFNTVNNGELIETINSAYYGILNVENTFGGEFEPINISARVDFYNGERFILSEDDNCTVFDSNQFNPISSTLEEYSTTPTFSGGSGNLFSGKTIDGIYSVDTNGERGEFQVFYEAPDYLKFNWTGGIYGETPYLNFDRNPFFYVESGFFRGNDRIIFTKELF